MAEKEKNTTDFGADPSNFVNRELSWLEFNYRVLSEAREDRKSTRLNSSHAT